MERRTALRMRVVYRRVTCPYGRNSYSDAYLKDRLIENGGWQEPGFTLDGPHRSGLNSLAAAVTAEGKDQKAEEVFGPFRLLHECYLDSLRPEHPCSGCKQAEKWKKTIGLRTYKLEPELTTANTLNQPHQEHPMRIVYLPLNQAGTEWYALNTFTGQRSEVVLHKRTVVPEERPPYDVFTRRSLYGHNLEQTTYEVNSEQLDAAITRGGMVPIPHTKPMWLGVEPRETWRCSCATCTGEEKRMLDPDNEVETLMRRHNVNTPGVRKSAHDYPSAPTSMFSGRPATQEQLDKARAKVTAKPRPDYVTVKRSTTHEPPKSAPAPKTKDGDDLITPASAMSDAFRNMKSVKKKTSKPAPATPKTSGKKKQPAAPPPLPKKKIAGGFNPSGKKKK